MTQSLLFNMFNNVNEDASLINALDRTNEIFKQLLECEDRMSLKSQGLLNELKSNWRHFFESSKSSAMFDGLPNARERETDSEKGFHKLEAKAMERQRIFINSKYKRKLLRIDDSLKLDDLRNSDYCEHCERRGHTEKVCRFLLTF